MREGGDRSPTPAQAGGRADGGKGKPGAPRPTLSVYDSEPEARPLHHSLFGEWSPSPAARERKAIGRGPQRRGGPVARRTATAPPNLDGGGAASASAEAVAEPASLARRLAP